MMTSTPLARLEQVMINLLSNALKNGERKPIRIRLDGDTKTAIIAVQDHGNGNLPLR